MAYVKSNFEIKEPNTEQKAEDNADTGGEVLGDIVCIVDAHSHQDPSGGLEQYCHPLDFMLVNLY